jgi:DNA-binding transcriptional LysR family regulator
MSLDKWLFHGPDGEELAHIDHTHFQVNTADALTEAVVAGMGIGALPVYSAVEGLRNGSLVRVMPGYSLFHLNIYALYPSRQFLDAKIRTWVEFLRDCIPGMLAEDEQLMLEHSARLPN